MKYKKVLLFSAFTLWASSLPSQAEEDSNYALSIISGLESYPDSDESSMSKGVGFSLIYDNLRYQNTYELGQNYYRGRFRYIYESDSEKYDNDRYRDSMDIKFHYQRPFMTLDENKQYLLSVHARYEGHYNSQQLEELEHLLVGGLAVNRRFEGAHAYDLGLILGLGYSNEEKDDDWPREYGGHDTDVLGRDGFGYFVEWNNTYTFSHTGVQLKGSVSHFDGRWQYDSGQFYKEDQLNVSVIVPLADKNNLLRIAVQYISRDYELDLIGFDDVLYRVGAEYIHYF